jgi:hypothetical protein
VCCQSFSFITNLSISLLVKRLGVGSVVWVALELRKLNNESRLNAYEKSFAPQIGTANMNFDKNQKSKIKSAEK